MVGELLAERQEFLELGNDAVLLGKGRQWYHTLLNFTFIYNWYGCHRRNLLQL